MAYLSKELGTINIQVPIEENLEEYKIVGWDNEKVLEIFKNLRFNRFIERFGLKSAETDKELETVIDIQETDISTIIEYAKNKNKIIYILGKRQCRK